mgnify:CR=1 FL=1
MSKRCELTGVSPLKGHNVSHSNNKTKRRFLPNLKKVRFRSDILKRDIKLNVTSSALRTVDFKGGLDKYLKSVKKKKKFQKESRNLNFQSQQDHNHIDDKNKQKTVYYIVNSDGFNSNIIKLLSSVSCLL